MLEEHGNMFDDHQTEQRNKYLSELGVKMLIHLWTADPRSHQYVASWTDLRSKGLNAKPPEECRKEMQNGL